MSQLVTFLANPDFLVLFTEYLCDISIFFRILILQKELCLSKLQIRIKKLIIGENTPNNINAFDVVFKKISSVEVIEIKNTLSPNLSLQVIKYLDNVKFSQLVSCNTIVNSFMGRNCKKFWCRLKHICFDYSEIFHDHEYFIPTEISDGENNIQENNLDYDSDDDYEEYLEYINNTCKVNNGVLKRINRHCKNIEYLQLNDVYSIDETCLSEVLNALGSSLLGISLKRNIFSETDLGRIILSSVVTSCKNLTYLNLYNRNICESIIIENVHNLRNLKYLNLNSTFENDMLVELVERFYWLEYFAVDVNHYTDFNEIVNIISLKYTNLKYFDCSFFPLNADEQIVKQNTLDNIFKNCKLLGLKLFIRYQDGNKIIDNNFIKAITKNCRKLETLSFSYALNKSINVDEMLTDLSNIEDIKYLDFGYNDGITLNKEHIKEKFGNIRAILPEEKSCLSFDVEYDEKEKDFYVKTQKTVY